MRCYQIDVYSYTQVQVNRRQVILRPKDQNGRQLKNGDGTNCGPYILNEE
jgi:hypothetical protein